MMEKIDNSYQEIVKSIIDFVGDSIGHRAIASEEGAAPVRLTGNGHGPAPVVGHFLVGKQGTRNEKIA